MLRQFKIFIYVILLILFKISMAQEPDTAWTGAYGNEDDESGQSVVESLDNGFIVAGTRTPSVGFSNGVLLKTDDRGDILWTNTLGEGATIESDVVWQADDGNIFVAGDINRGSFSDMYLCKLNSDGDSLWLKAYGGDSNENTNDMVQTSDNGFVITGWTVSYGSGSFDVYLVRTDSEGDTLWTKTFGGTENDIGNSVKETQDGGFIVAGFSNSFSDNNNDIYLIKTDENGDTLWTKTFKINGNDIARSVIQTSDGGYAICGDTDSFGEEKDFYLVKTNNDGDTLWTKIYGGNGTEIASSIRETEDEGMIMVGRTNSFGEGFDDVYILRTDSEGDTSSGSGWVKIIGGGSFDQANSVKQTNDGGFIVAGETSSFSQNSDIYLIRLESDVTNVFNKTKYFNEKQFILHQNYPNPFNPETTIPFTISNSARIDLDVYNVKGQKITTLVSDYLPGGNYRFNWNSGNVSSGVYIYSLQVNGKISQSRKMLLIR